MTDFERDYDQDFAARSGQPDYGGRGGTEESSTQGVRARARGAGRAARRQAGELGHRAGNLFEEHPLIVGAGVALLGALIGMALPRSRREDELVGEASDRAVEMAREKAGALRDVAVRTVEQAAATAKEELEGRGLTPEGLKDKAGDVADEVKAAAGEVAKDAKEAAKKTAQEAKETAKKEADKNLKSEGGSKGGGGSKGS